MTRSSVGWPRICGNLGQGPTRQEEARDGRDQSTGVERLPALLSDALDSPIVLDGIGRRVQTEGGGRPRGDDDRATRLPRPVRPPPGPTYSAARLSKQNGPSQDRVALSLGMVRPTDASTRHYRGCADPLLELHAARDARRMRLSEK
jgi:hypothetical protein